MKPLLTIDEVAKFLSLSRDTIYRMSQRAMIPATKVGMQWRYSAKEIENWLSRNKNTSQKMTKMQLSNSKRKRK